MLSDRGAFYSTLDADSEGAEGKYYVWTVGDVRAAVGSDDDARLLIEHFGLTEAGNWHESPVDGASVLAVAAPVEQLAEKRNVPAADLRARVDRLLLKLRAFRARRVRPGLDDKILTAWNGLMISALAICGRVLREPRYLEAAHRAIGFLLTRHMEGGRRLLRVSRHGQAHTDAFLDDHAFLLNGLMDLIDSTSPTSLPGTMARKRALELADTLIADFEDPARGGFFYTSPRHEQLFARMKNAADNATPSANGVAIRALLRLARSSGKEHYRDVALRAVAAFADNVRRRPEYFPTLLLALAEDLHADRGRGMGPLPTGPTTLVGSLPPRDEPGAETSSLLRLVVDEVPPLKPGAAFELRARLTVAEGYHVQPNEPTDREAFKTVARLRGELAVTIQEWNYPAATAAGPGQPAGYAGTVLLSARGGVLPTAAAGRYLMRLTVLAQPCSGTACLPPERASAEFTLVIE
jgi:hypothetical protein